MRQTQTGTAERRRRRAATLLIATVVGVGALTGGTAAQAAPSDNWQHARQCFQGWRTLKTSDGRSFRNIRDCVFYALRGGQFGSTTTPPLPPPPPPPAPPTTGGNTE